MEQGKYRERFFGEQLLFGECYRFSDTFGLHIGNGGQQTLHGKCLEIMAIPKIVYISFIIYIHSSIMTLTVSPPIIQKERRSGFLPILRQRPALCGTLYRTWGVAALTLPIGVTAGQLPVFARSSASDILSGESSYSHER